ncbi:hypothetical protein B0H14DRAFT_2278561, partial [Mycena olivaceomarginata]
FVLTEAELTCQSLWLTMSTVVHKPRHAQMGRNPELRALFYKLASLSDAHITVFVFNGPHRPSTKHNKKVLQHPPGLWKRFTELLELFGFYFYMPGEGEAELAHLSKHGFIDAVS